MTITQLRAFLAAFELGSFTAAAIELDLTQASVSELISRLESHLGVKLFIRNSKGLLPTAAAHTLRPHALSSLRELDAGEEAVQGIKDLKGGTSTFGVMRIANYYDLADLAQTFHAKFPKVHIRLLGLNSAFVAESVSRGEIEGGLVVLPISAPNLEIKPLFKDELFFASTTRPVDNGPITIEEFAESNLVLFDAHAGNQDPTRKQLTDRAMAAGVTLTPVIEVEQLDTAVDLVANGAGDTLVSRSVIERPNFPTHIRLFRFADPLYDTVALIQRAGIQLSPATAQFAAMAESLLRKRLKINNQGIVDQASIQHLICE